MKSIILVRHATAEVRNPQLSDFERKLIKRGRKESRKMAERFRKYQFIPKIWISSSAPRALETAQIFADTLSFAGEKILKEDALYDENSSKSYLKLIKSLPSNRNSVIFFGHDPGISEAAAQLANAFALAFPKAGIVAVRFLEDSWNKINLAEGFLTLIEFPGSQKGISRILQNDLSRLLVRQNENIITTLTPKITKKMQKTIKSYSEKIAKEIVDYRKRKL